MALDQLMIVKWRIMNRNVAVVYKFTKSQSCVFCLWLVYWLIVNMLNQHPPVGFATSPFYLPDLLIPDPPCVLKEPVIKWEIDLPQPMQP